MQNLNAQDHWKQQVGAAAAALVQPGMVVGLGSGSTSAQFILALGTRIQQGLTIVGGIPTSNAAEALARSVAVPITTLDQHPQIDLAIDGADEIDPHLNLIKGAGGALLREKVVATAARQFVVIGDTTKQVQRLGERTRLPIEVLPFAIATVKLRLQSLGLLGDVRQQDGRTYFTDNGNLIY